MVWNIRSFIFRSYRTSKYKVQSTNTRTRRTVIWCLAIAGPFSGSPWSTLNLPSHHRIWTTGSPTNQPTSLSARNKNRWTIIFWNWIGASRMRIGPGCPPGRDGVMYVCTSRFRRGVKGLPTSSIYKSSLIQAIPGWKSRQLLYDLG